MTTAGYVPDAGEVVWLDFEVLIEGTPRCVVLADQIDSKDWRARNADCKGRVSGGELAEVRAKLAALIR